MHFKKPLMLLMDANSKKSILINNAYYRLNLPKGLKTKTIQMKKNVSLTFGLKSRRSVDVDSVLSYVFEKQCFTDEK